MNRRDALRLLSIGVPAGLLLPSLFTSCRDESLFDGISYKGKVIIIGAGPAGLYAAELLRKRNVDVTILEASSRYGGRIRSLNGFADFPVELGAEEVHGQRSIWYDLVRSVTGIEYVDLESEQDVIMIDGVLQLLASIETDTDIAAADTFAAGLGESYSGGDITVLQYLQQHGFSSRILPYLEALLGSEWGTSNDRLGLLGVATENSRWTAGEANFMVKNRSFASILEEKLAEAISRVQLNTQVKTIDYSGSRILLTDQNNVTYEADRVIVTVPLPVLRDGDISFIPALDTARTDAFHRIGMGAGMKVILQFNARFWSAGTGSIYGAGPVPEYWSPGANGKSAADNVLTAFVMGVYAENLLALGSGMIPAILADLDSMYGGGIASNSLTSSVVMDWGADPFTKGTYSYPMPGGEGARELIAAPLANKIFFAGEATHTAGQNSTVHGAMETGFRAVDELFKSGNE